MISMIFTIFVVVVIPLFCIHVLGKRSTSFLPKSTVPTTNEAKYMESLKILANLSHNANKLHYK